MFNFTLHHSVADKWNLPWLDVKIFVLLEIISCIASMRYYSLFSFAWQEYVPHILLLSV